MDSKLIYLAIPYSSESDIVKNERVAKVNKVAAKLINQGEMIFSPISMTHSIALSGKLRGDWDFWKGFCRTYLLHCCKVYILMLDGWKESVGVQAEIEIAEELGLEIKYIKYSTFVND